MNDRVMRTAVIAIAASLVACGTETSTTPTSPPKSAPTSMEDSTCAVLPADADFGGWKHVSNTEDCLRELAYGDWPRAQSEAAHIAGWEIAGPDLNELIATLARYESAAAVHAAMQARGLLSGDGDPDVREYYGEDWRPLTGSDWLLEAGNRFGFDAETGMHPNHHDALLYELAELFGDSFADATFAETAPAWDSEEPYQLRATLGDREWSRQAENYGDWYDVGAVLDLINEMATETGIPERIMPLETYDQTVTVIVADGTALVAAAADGLLVPAGAASSMERGKAFEDEIRRLYRIGVE